MKKISIFCPQCKKKLEIPLPPSLTQKINEKKVHHFPVPYKYIHGTPPHGITIYIDAHFDTRSYEVVEEIGFDQKAIQFLIESAPISPTSTTGDVLRVFLNTILNILISHFNLNSKIQFEIGYHLGQTFVGAFDDASLQTEDDYIKAISSFWKQHNLGILTIQGFQHNSLIVQLQDHFELNSSSHSNQPNCHISRGILTGLLETRFLAKFEISETKCCSTGDEFCEFQVVEKLEIAPS